MDAIYIYEGAHGKGQEGHELVRMAAAMYTAELAMDFDPWKCRISTEDKGKPFFEGRPFEFSLSHSGSLWMCAFSDGPLGLDLQIVRDCDCHKLAERFFLREEARAVKEQGRDMFFRIWVRKEAYCKMSGAGFFGGDLPPVLKDKGVYGGRPFFFREIEIADDMKCVMCTEKISEPEMRMLG